MIHGCVLSRALNGAQGQKKMQGGRRVGGERGGTKHTGQLLEAGSPGELNPPTRQWCGGHREEVTCIDS